MPRTKLRRSSRIPKEPKPEEIRPVYTNDGQRLRISKLTKKTEEECLRLIAKPKNQIKSIEKVAYNGKGSRPWGISVRAYRTYVNYETLEKCDTVLKNYFARMKLARKNKEKLTPAQRREIELELEQMTDDVSEAENVGTTSFSVRSIEDGFYTEHLSGNLLSFREYYLVEWCEYVIARGSFNDYKDDEKYAEMKARYDKAIARYNKKMANFKKQSIVEPIQVKEPTKVNQPVRAEIKSTDKKTRSRAAIKPPAKFEDDPTCQLARVSNAQTSSSIEAGIVVKRGRGRPRKVPTDVKSMIEDVIETEFHADSGMQPMSVHSDTTIAGSPLPASPFPSGSRTLKRSIENDLSDTDYDSYSSDNDTIISRISEQAYSPSGSSLMALSQNRPVKLVEPARRQRIFLEPRNTSPICEQVSSTTGSLGTTVGGQGYGLVASPQGQSHNQLMPQQNVTVSVPNSQTLPIGQYILSRPSLVTTSEPNWYGSNSNMQYSNASFSQLQGQAAPTLGNGWPNTNSPLDMPSMPLMANAVLNRDMPMVNAVQAHGIMPSTNRILGYNSPNANTTNEHGMLPTGRFVLPKFNGLLEEGIRMANDYLGPSLSMANGLQEQHSLAAVNPIQQQQQGLPMTNGYFVSDLPIGNGMNRMPSLSRTNEAVQHSVPMAEAVQVRGLSNAGRVQDAPMTNYFMEDTIPLADVFQSQGINLLTDHDLSMLQEIEYSSMPLTNAYQEQTLPSVNAYFDHDMQMVNDYHQYNMEQTNGAMEQQQQHTVPTGQQSETYNIEGAYNFPDSNSIEPIMPTNVSDELMEQYVPSEDITELPHFTPMNRAWGSANSMQLDVGQQQQQHYMETTDGMNPLEGLTRMCSGMQT